MKNSIYACMHLQKQMHMSVLYMYPCTQFLIANDCIFFFSFSSTVNLWWRGRVAFCRISDFRLYVIGCKGWRSCCGRCESLWAWSRYSISDFRRNFCDWCCRLWTFCGRGRDAESVVSTGMWLVALADGDAGCEPLWEGRDAESVIGFNSFNGVAGCEPLRAWSRCKMIHGCI